MELLVWVRNHRGPGDDDPRGRGTYVGAALGHSPAPARLETRGPMTSMAEFRVAADVADPVAELREAVAEVFARLGGDRHGRTLYYARSASAIRVRLEPGFDEPIHIEQELAEILAVCSPHHSPSHDRTTAP